MKNLKRLLGLMAISGFAFGFAGNVKAAQNDVNSGFETCLTNGAANSTCTLTSSKTISNSITIGGTNTSIVLKNNAVLTLSNPLIIPTGKTVTKNIITKDEIEDNMEVLLSYENNYDGFYRVEVLADC